MIQKGVIRKMGQYYRNNPEYEEEVLRGVKEFFGEENVFNTDQPFFNEWMMYDFKFSDGKGMLEKFYEENPMGIPLYRREIYNTLKENYYGLFQVLEVRPLSGLVVKRLKDGKIFEVSEVSLTMQIEKDDVFASRIAKTIDHYEFVGSDTQAIQLSKSPDQKLKKRYLEKILPKIKMENPKDAMIFYQHLIISNDHSY